MPTLSGGVYYVQGGVQYPAIANPRISGLTCESCHVEGANFAPVATNPTTDHNGEHKPERRYVASVVFPYPDLLTGTTGTVSTVIPATQAQITAVTIFNGAKGTAAQDDSFVCMTCHRARESKLTVEANDPTGATGTFILTTRSPHHLPAGAVLYGSKAAVGYQYTGQTYAQRWDHDLGYTNAYPATSAPKARCTYCHMEGGTHEFVAKLTATCAGCHTATSIDELTPFARPEDNYDNDPLTKPKAELGVFAARLQTAIQNYAKAAKTAGTTGAEWVLWYNRGDNPLSTASSNFYKDGNHSGVLELSELVSANTPKWDTKGYRATFNNLLWMEFPQAWAHNPKYILQILYDSANDLDPTTVVGLTRP
jgi:hypothetical protein